MPGSETDDLVYKLNDLIAPQVDCTACGACCRSLMINVTDFDAERISGRLNIPVRTFKKDFIEESVQGQMIMNRIPCHFLEENSCTVYEHRFTECREFPHLHKKNFKGRLFGTLVHYAMCPIIFNVVENLKYETGFLTEERH
jgi:Fe-S-cluster containining protein